MALTGSRRGRWGAPGLSSVAFCCVGEGQRGKRERALTSCRNPHGATGASAPQAAAREAHARRSDGARRLHLCSRSMPLRGLDAGGAQERRRPPSLEHLLLLCVALCRFLCCAHARVCMRLWIDRRGECDVCVKSGQGQRRTEIESGARTASASASLRFVAENRAPAARAVSPVSVRMSLTRALQVRVLIALASSSATHT
jgi:hypothetical protein